MNILFVSLGCDKNLVDTEVMLGLLAARGHQMVDDETIADVIVVIGDGKVKKQGPGIMLLPEILQNSSVGKFGCPKGREVR